MERWVDCAEQCPREALRVRVPLLCMRPGKEQGEGPRAWLYSAASALLWLGGFISILTRETEAQGG